MLDTFQRFFMTILEGSDYPAILQRAKLSLRRLLAEVGFESENADAEARGWKLPVYGYELLTPSIEKGDVDIVKLLNFQFTIYQFFGFFFVFRCGSVRLSVRPGTQSHLILRVGFKQCQEKRRREKELRRKTTLQIFKGKVISTR